MLKISVFAALLGAAGLASTAFAEDMRAQSYGSPNYGSYKGGPNIDSGVNRYCPPGYVPQSFPSGPGVRCEAPDGGAPYYPM